MGSQSVPSSTSQFQQAATGIWGSPQAIALATPILRPALGNIKEQQDMLLGVQHGDPIQTAKFYGLPSDASAEDIGHTASLYSHGATPSMPAQNKATQPISGGQLTQPTKTAAHGGIMSLGESDSQSDPRRKFASGGSSAKAPTALSATQTAAMNKLQAASDAGKKLSTTQQKQLASYTAKNTAYNNYQTQTADTQKQLASQGITPAAAFQGKAGLFGTEYNPIKNTIDVTNPYYNQAVNVLQGMNTAPEQFGQASAAYNQAIAGLQGAAGYTPQQVTAQQVGGTGYQATGMQAPKDVQAQNYSAALMQGAPDVQAINAQANQMAAPQDVRAVRTRAAQMQGPQSWTTPGTAEQYMDPYVQNVLKSQLNLANQQFAQQQQGLASQAAQSKAYGGARQALQAGQAQLNQNLANQNLTAQALSNAYQSGMGQFNTAQGQKLSAGQANLSAAQQANLANQQAAMTAQQLNQAAGLTAGQANLSAAQQTALANQQAGMTAQQLNQLYGFGGFQSQAANQAAQNAAMQQYMNNALAASQTSYGGQLTAAQQNQAAQNQAAQFAAANQQQANLANQNAALQAAYYNQGAGLQGNQQAIGAYGQALGGAGGLGSLGSSIGGYGMNLANAWGQAGSTYQGLGQAAANQTQQNAANIYGGPTTLGTQGINMLTGMGGGTSGASTQQTKTG